MTAKEKGGSLGVNIERKGCPGANIEKQLKSLKITSWGLAYFSCSYVLQYT